VYSLSVDDGPERYITAFHVSAEWLAKLEAPDENPHLKYNASLGSLLSEFAPARTGS
jgi:hypothetical protein